MLQVDGRAPWTSAVKSSAILQDALSLSDNVGDKVEVTLMRNDVTFKATMVRMSVERVQAIRDWMELQSQNATHVIHKQDKEAIQYSSELLNGMVEILKQHHRYEKMMTGRINQVRVACTPALFLVSKHL